MPKLKLYRNDSFDLLLTGFFMMKTLVNNNHFRNSFLVVTNFTSTVFVGHSINLPNIALFLNLAFSFLIQLPSFSASLFKSISRLIYGFKSGSCLNSKIKLIFFYCNPKFKLSFRF